METLWFCLIAFMIGTYVVLDGYDLGVGAIHLLIARSEAERKLSIATIAPVWDGNEVWLVAAGGTLYLAFPALYAASFSGFYLPLMIVLWLLILRGISIEFRSHLRSPLWTPLWDVVFCAASLLLAVFFGAALGNVIRGVPLRADGTFFEPLWTDFRVGPDAGILDWYTITVGAASLAACALHGSLWIALKTEGELRRRARSVAGKASLAVCVLTLVVSVFTWIVQPRVAAHLAESPWGLVFPALALLGLGMLRVFLARHHDLRAFLASCAYLLGMLTSAAFGIYPYVLPSLTDPARALSVHNSAAPRHALAIGLMWWIPGMLLGAVYFLYLYRRFSGKLELPHAPHGHGTFET